MKIVRCNLKSGGQGYKVINLATDRAVYSSFSRIDCEQYVYAKSIK